MIIEKLNQSFSHLISQSPQDTKTLQFLKEILKVEKDGWQYDFQIRIGRVDKYRYFYREIDEHTIEVANGLLEIPPVREYLNLEDLEVFDISKYQNRDGSLKPNYSEYLDSLDPAMVSEISRIKELLPFEPYAYQEIAVYEALRNEISISKMCTGSGKSLTISIILEYFRNQGLKGALIVPNINLLTQFANDIKSYNLMEVHKGIQKAGGGSKVSKIEEDKFLLLTTWQSLRNLDTEVLKGLDFIICDEVHKFSSYCTSQLVLDSSESRYKLGFTGTLPSSKVSKMVLMGLFGMPTQIIRSSDLISMGRGTPIKIHALKLIHTAEDSKRIGLYKEYLDRVKYIGNMDPRTKMISKLANKLRDSNQGGTLVLYTLIDHGMEIYKEICGEYPGDLERQKELGVFFMEGSVKAKEREAMRQAMDSMNNACMVANYSLLSTGVNIKTLRYAIFSSPLKSYTTIAQSLGRGIRLSEGKEVFEVYDFVDHFPSGPTSFNNSYRTRKKTYEMENFEVTERKIKMSQANPP